MADRVGGTFDPQAVESLDEALVWATNLGWPIWVTNGQGNDEPSKTEHDFSQHTLGEGARIDFHRIHVFLTLHFRHSTLFLVSHNCLTRQTPRGRQVGR